MEPEDRATAEEQARHRLALAPIKARLKDDGFYAYETFDDQGRLIIAADDEAGRVDVRVGSDGFAVEVWGGSPGLFAEEDAEYRRRTLERLVRIQLPALNRGMLAPHQRALWDETEGGVQVRLSYELPFTRAADIATFVRERFVELDEVLTFVEGQVTP